jgi:predicted Zn-dependent protease
MTDRILTRRAALRATCGHCLGLAALLQAHPAASQGSNALPAAPTQPPAMPARFGRPALDTDEGGLWALMDREEAKLRRSPFLVRDDTLTRYVQAIVCRLGAEHCPDVRVHLVRTPWFNASMAPNGMMQVWTGLLLRVENEAQLAAVLGHELGHYLERHSVEQLREMKSRAAFAQFLGAFGAVGAVGQLGMLAGAFAFSREHETRADRLGMRLMKQCGYDGTQAAKVWDNLLGELKVTAGEDAGKRSPMMATHPPVVTRRDDLLKLAGDASGEVGAEVFRQAVKPHRRGWLRDEVKRGQYEESLVLFDRGLAQDANDADLLYARGEVYRLRAGKEDAEKALKDLVQATATDAAPPDAWRSLGLHHKQQQQPANAVAAFEKYLGYAANAPDAELIKHYITELTP